MAIGRRSGLRAMLAAYLLLDVSWDGASYGAADLDLAVASFAFDAGNLGFANIWLAMGSFAVCCGWVVLSTRVLGRWLGWWAIVAGGWADSPVRLVGPNLVRAVRTLLVVGDHRLHTADPPKDRFVGGGRGGLVLSTSAGVPVLDTHPPRMIQRESERVKLASSSGGSKGRGAP